MKNVEMKKDEDIIAYARRVLKVVWGRIAGIALIEVVITTLAAVAIGAIFYTVNTSNQDYFNWDVDFQNPDTAVFGTLQSDAWIPFIVIVAVTLLIMLFAYIATISVVTHNKSFKEAIKFGITRGFHAVPVLLLSFLLVLVGGVPSLLIIVLALMMESALTLLFVLLALVLLVLPIVLSLRTFFVVFVWIENQKETAWSIIKKSFALTKGSVSWMILLFLLVFGTINSILSEDTGSITLSLIQIAAMVGLVTPVLYSVMYAIYESAKRKNGKTPVTEK